MAPRALSSKAQAAACYTATLTALLLAAGLATALSDDPPMGLIGNLVNAYVTGDSPVSTPADAASRASVSVDKAMRPATDALEALLLAFQAATATSAAAATVAPASSSATAEHAAAAVGAPSLWGTGAGGRDADAELQLLQLRLAQLALNGGAAVALAPESGVQDGASDVDVAADYPELYDADVSYEDAADYPRSYDADADSDEADVAAPVAELPYDVYDDSRQDEDDMPASAAALVTSVLAAEVLAEVVAAQLLIGRPGASTAGNPVQPSLGTLHDIPAVLAGGNGQDDDAQYDISDLYTENDSYDPYYLYDADGVAGRAPGDSARAVGASDLQAGGNGDEGGNDQAVRSEFNSSRGGSRSSTSFADRIAVAVSRRRLLAPGDDRRDPRGPPRGGRPGPDPRPRPDPADLPPANVWVPGVVRVTRDSDGDVKVRVGPLGAISSVTVTPPENVRQQQQQQQQRQQAPPSMGAGGGGAAAAPFAAGPGAAAAAAAAAVAAAPADAGIAAFRSAGVSGTAGMPAADGGLLPPISPASAVGAVVGGAIGTGVGGAAGGPLGAIAGGAVGRTVGGTVGDAAAARSAAAAAGGGGGIFGATAANPATAVAADKSGLVNIFAPDDDAVTLQQSSPRRSTTTDAEGTASDNGRGGGGAAAASAEPRERPRVAVTVGPAGSLVRSISGPQGSTTKVGLGGGIARVTSVAQP